MIEFDKDEALRKFHETAKERGVDPSSVEPELLDFAVNSTPHLRQFMATMSKLFAESIRAVYGSLPKEMEDSEKFKEVVASALFSYITGVMDETQAKKMGVMIMMDQSGAFDGIKKKIQEEIDKTKSNGENN